MYKQTRRSVRLFAVIFAASAVIAIGNLKAQTQRLESPGLGAPTDFKLQSAGAEHLQRLTARMQDLGLDKNHTFRVLEAHDDDLGWTHVRMQQHFGGLRVVHGIAISHSDPNGHFSYTDSIKRNINISLSPALTSENALAVAERQESHLGPYSSPPKVDLVVFPVTELVAAPDASVDNPVAIERVVKEYRLAYEVETRETLNGPVPGLNAWIYYVDARTGEVLDSMSLIEYGTGNGQFIKNASFPTLNVLGNFQMIDTLRNLSTWDSNTLTFLPPNADSDDFWGDGLPFQGLAASIVNRQTAMVDAYAGAEVFWDLLFNVFGRLGTDGSNGHVDIYTHWGAGGVENGIFLPPSSIYLGDGPTIPRPDVVGHELGHSLNFHTSHFQGPEGAGLNESNSDIWGALTSFYFGGGGFTNHLKVIPANGGTWTSGSGRDMIKPSRAGGLADYWYPAISLISDAHRRGEPNNRAFHFLAEGASPIMTDPSYSERLPFGMTGIGVQSAARIWYDALSWIPANAGYGDVMNAALNAAITRFGITSKEVAAVQNAYAGIGVGARAATYTPVTITFETPGHNAQWTPLQLPAAQQQFVVSNGKFVLLHTNLAQGTNAGETDWYSISVPAGTRVKAGVLPRLSLAPEQYEVQVFDQLGTLKGTASSTPGIFVAADVLGTTPLLQTQQTVLFRVRRLLGSGTGMYELSIQF